MPTVVRLLGDLNLSTNGFAILLIWRLGGVEVNTLQDANVNTVSCNKMYVDSQASSGKKQVGKHDTLNHHKIGFRVASALSV